MDKKKIIFHSPKKYLFISLVSLILIVILFFVRGINYLSLIDAVFAIGVINIVLGLMSLLSFLGAFDTFSFSFYYVKKSFSNKKDEIKDLYDYKNKMNTKRDKKVFTFTPYIIIGAIFIIISIILKFILL